VERPGVANINSAFHPLPAPFFSGRPTTGMALGMSAGHVARGGSGPERTEVRAPDGGLIWLQLSRGPPGAVPISTKRLRSSIQFEIEHMQRKEDP